MRPRSTCTTLMGKEECGEGKELFMIQNIPPHQWSMVVVVLVAWACMAADGTGSLVFIDDVTDDKSSRMRSEVFRATLSAHIQPNASELETVIIPTPFIWFGCKYPQIKAESLQFKHILFVSFKSIVVVYRATGESSQTCHCLAIFIKSYRVRAELVDC